MAVLDLKIMETAAKDASAIVTEFVKSYTADLTIVINLPTCKTKTPLRPAEVLERAEPLQVTQVNDR